MKSYTSHYRSPLGNIALATDGTDLTEENETIFAARHFLSGKRQAA